MILLHLSDAVVHAKVPGTPLSLELEISSGPSGFQMPTALVREEVRPIKSEIAICDFAKYDFAKYVSL
jgi:hypothetical protein